MSDGQLCNYERMCKEFSCMGPFITGIAECELCGYMERVVKVIHKRHPMNETWECRRCGQTQMFLMDLRREALE